MRMKRSLEMFYAQDMTEVAVSEVHGLKRKKRPVEEIFGKFKWGFWQRLNLV